MKLEKEQKRLDEEKWLKSEKEGRDVCGEFDYCKFCDKNLAHPCATALGKATVKPAKKTCAKKTTKKAEEKKVAPKAAAKKTTKTTTKAKK